MCPNDCIMLYLSSYRGITAKGFNGSIKDVQLGGASRRLNLHTEMKNAYSGCPRVRVAKIYLVCTNANYDRLLSPVKSSLQCAHMACSVMWICFVREKFEKMQVYERQE